MASAGRLGIFRRRSTPAPQTFRISSPRRSGPWSLTSSAARVDPADPQDAKVQRMLRQGWQSDAWNYRDQIGELRYAVNFLAQCTARMRIFPAFYPLAGESDEPVPLAQATGIPDSVHQDLVSAAAAATQSLGNGRTAISGLLHRISSNKTIAGEWYLLGRTDPETGIERFSARSVDELVVDEGKWKLREVPDDRQNGVIPWVELDPDQTVIQRVWTPHPRFELLADSALKAMLDDCESLMILRRMIRATGRSRLASRGLLLVPDELSISVPIDDDADPEADPFMSALTQAMMVPIENEGTADGVVPIVIRGPGDRLDQVKLVDLSTDFDEQGSKTRAEMIGVIATGLDLPKEVITGVADLNHWSAWQVDDNTFRHHVEPHVIACCDDLSAAYLRPYLIAAGIPEQWAQSAVYWYDPTELVTHPDRSADAQRAYDAMAISAKAYRDASGFADEDAPSIEELEMRRVMDIRALPLNLLMELARRADPSLVVPPINIAGTVPGIKAGGVDVGTPPATDAPAAASTAATPAAPTTGPPAAHADPAPAPPGPPAAERPTPHPPGITASGARAAANRRLSAKLCSIDQQLRARLQTAANAAVLRQLERAGARLRSKVARDETLRTRIAHRANERVPALLGREVVAAAGLSDGQLISGDWGALRTQFLDWTKSAQTQALQVAIRLAQIDDDSPAVAAAAATQEQSADAAWDALAGALTTLATHLLYSPDPNAGPGDWATLNPDTLVPAGTIRAALAIAGGTPAQTVALAPSTGATAAAAPVGQIGTGPTLGELLDQHGVARQGYEWVHGPSLDPFEPHEALDGVQFENFDDPQLQNTSGFPDNQYYMPGDHEGCLCDFMPIYLSPDEED